MNAKLWILGLALALQGCSSLALQTNPFTTRPGAASGQQVFTVDWWLPLVDPKFLEYAPREHASPAIDPDTRRILTLTRDGFVRAIASDGAVEWRYQTAGSFSAGATILDGTAYVPGGDGNLYAFGVRTGKLLWKYAAGEELATSPIVANGMVFVVSHGDTVYAVDVQSGKWKWQYRRDPPTGFSVRGVSTPRLQGSVLYVGFADGHIVALNAQDGALKWQRALGQTVGDFVDSDAAPVLDDSGRLYVTSYKEGVFALDAATGDVQWQAKSTGLNHLSAQPNVLFAGGDEQLEAIHTATGRVIWSLPLKDEAARAPAIVKKTLAVPIASALLFVDARTGAVQTRWDPGQGVSATPTATGRRLYVLSNLGYLYALTVGGGG